jgi:SAM-dependent methyltransferase
VTDAFGFHALQLGLPELDGLRANRMPHRWVASDTLRGARAAAGAAAARRRRLTTHPPTMPVACTASSTRCPFPSASIDLVVLPHALELARDPHQTLREVERVLRPKAAW